jgi:hypothetical protein
MFNPTPYDMLAPADALADYLAMVEGLSDIPVIVGRQKDLESEINEAVAKATGAAIMISLEGWNVIIPDSSDCHLNAEFSLSIWTTPVLYPGATEESVILGLLISAMQRYTPDPEDCDARWVTSSGAHVQHPDHRVYEFPATYELSLPPVTLIGEEP